MLPRRRLAFTCSVELAGQECQLTIGPFEDGRPGEVFISTGFKEGSDLAFQADDICILISLCLQMGITARHLHRTMGNHSMAGQIAQVLADYDVDVIEGTEPSLPGLEDRKDA